MYVNSIFFFCFFSFLSFFLSFLSFLSVISFLSFLSYLFFFFIYLSYLTYLSYLSYLSNLSFCAVPKLPTGKLMPVTETLISGSQPNLEQLKNLGLIGIKSVLNLRTNEEQGLFLFRFCFLYYILNFICFI
jgi:hypothetical protein